MLDYGSIGRDKFADRSLLFTLNFCSKELWQPSHRRNLNQKSSLAINAREKAIPSLETVGEKSSVLKPVRFVKAEATSYKQMPNAKLEMRSLWLGGKYLISSAILTRYFFAYRLLKLRLAKVRDTSYKQMPNAKLEMRSLWLVGKYLTLSAILTRYFLPTGYWNLFVWRR